MGSHCDVDSSLSAVHIDGEESIVISHCSARFGVLCRLSSVWSLSELSLSDSSGFESLSELSSVA